MTFPSESTLGYGLEQAPPDTLRAMLAQVMQAALQQEFDRLLGAGRWERSGERPGWRNGSKRRRLHTRVDTSELRSPKDREGRVQPSLFERYQRSEKAFVLALVEMYIQGVSTRKVQKVVEQLCGVLVSASQVSPLTKRRIAPDPAAPDPRRVILVDTSVWIRHLRSGEKELVGALEAGQVAMHPFVLGELACGDLRNRSEVLSLLSRLPAAPVASASEVLRFIELRALMGRGIGYVDVHLLVSATLGTLRLWTHDKRLARVASELNSSTGSAP